MNYFTPARYLRLGNLENEDEFLAAQQGWEDAISGYRAHLDAIKGRLPPRLRRFLTRDGVYLHDARVLSIHQRTDHLVITLQPGSLPDRLVVFEYWLVEEPLIQIDQLPPDRCREPIEWLYDEVDLDRPEGPRGLPVHLPVRQTNPPTFRHNILLSNGWELTVRFRNVRVEVPLRVVPVPPRAARREKSA